MQSIPGLAYFGKQVFVEDGVTDVPPPPVVKPPVTDFVVLPWGTSVGTHTELVEAGKVRVFQLNVPLISTGGKYCSFAISPTGTRDYSARQLCLSDTPYEFTRRLSNAALVQSNDGSGRIYFSVGGYPLDQYQRPNQRYPDLVPGKTYFFSVAQLDSALACHINYSLTVA